MLKKLQHTILCLWFALCGLSTYAQEVTIEIDATNQDKVLQTVEVPEGSDLFIKITNIGSEIDQFSFKADSLDANQLNAINSAKESVGSTAVRFNLREHINHIKASKSGMKYIIEYSGSQSLTRFNNADKKYKGAIKIIPKKEGGGPTKKPKDPKSIPYPAFPTRDVAFDACNKSDRFLLIDADPMSNKASALYKCDGKGSKDDWFAGKKKVSYVSNQSSIKVVVRNYTLLSDKSITVSITADNFSYQKTIYDLFNAAGVGTPEKDSASQNISADGNSDKPKKEESASALYNYLDSAYRSIHGKSGWSLAEFRMLEQFKQDLKTAIGQRKLTPSEVILYSKIIGWYPEYVILNELPMKIEESDKIRVNIQFNENNATTVVTVGEYWVSGGIKPSIGTNLYISGLSNNAIYTDSVATANGNELRAVLDSSNRSSVGIGVSGEIAWRTPGYVRPILNLGFFVPFQEDITAFGVVGVGASIATGDVKFSISAGAAFGKVNVINQRYVDKDLSQFGTLTNADLVDKSWQWSWQVGVGFSYNL